MKVTLQKTGTRKMRNCDAIDIAYKNSYPVCPKKSSYTGMICWDVQEGFLN